MSPLAIFRSLIRFSAWVHPIVQKWRKDREKNRTEGASHLKVGNNAEAEKSLLLAMEEAEKRRTTNKYRFEVCMDLAEAQRRLCKYGAALENIERANKLVPSRASDCLQLRAQIEI